MNEATEAVKGLLDAERKCAKDFDKSGLIGKGAAKRFEKEASRLLTALTGGLKPPVEAIKALGEY